MFQTPNVFALGALGPLLVLGALAATEPKPAVWSNGAFGPDGPWNAVEVSFGGQPTIALFPGRMWESFVTTSDYCAVNNSVPHCASGTYLKDAAVAGSQTNYAVRIDFKSPTQAMSPGLLISGTSNLYVDTVDLGLNDVVLNHSLSLIESDSMMLVYPGGMRYPIFTGCLNIGGPEEYQVFGGNDERPTVNATMIPWYLKGIGRTASSSFGLHYGSAVPAARILGSLLFGGYDRNRVVGDVLSFKGDLTQPITIKDIGIRVVKGSSPFAPESAAGLLAQGNSSIPGTGLSVLLDPCNPYLTLPKSTCDNIAAHLPVSYNASLGFYLWDVSSPRYTPIVTSASALTFTIMGETNTEMLTINIGVPYFPCFTSGTGAFTLGRAFFQDAFLGANWEASRAWLAQAPGPNIPGGPDAVNVQAEETSITAGGNDWERSWDGFWSLLSADEAASVRSAPAPSETGSVPHSPLPSEREEEDGEEAGLSVAATAGIAVGTAVLGMAVVGAGVLFWCRRRRTTSPVSSPGAQSEPEPTTQSKQQKRQGTSSLMKGQEWPGALVEAPGPDPPARWHEMPAD